MSFSKNIRRVVSILCVLMTMSAFIIVPAMATEDLGPEAPDKQYGVVTASTLNVRASADADAEIITTLTMGTYVRIEWTQPEWVCVDYNNGGSRGFVSDEYLKVYEGDIPEFDSTGGQAVVEVAKMYLGVPYVYGGTSPNGFDCSGLMQFVYKQLGYSINRVAADQMNNGVAIAKEDMAPGDLVGFYSSPGSGYVSHIGMYVGDGMMIHAPHTGDVVRFASIEEGTYYNARFAGARRIIY